MAPHDPPVICEIYIQQHTTFWGFTYRLLNTEQVVNFNQCEQVVPALVPVAGITEACLVRW